MFAVVQTGGKQYKVAQGDVLKVEKLAGNAGDKITLDTVLAVGGDKPQVGTPTVAGASVNAEILEQAKDKKVIVFKKKRRHNYRRKLGHRQELTTLRILDVPGAGAKKAAPAKAKETKAAAEKKPAAKKTTQKAEDTK